MGKISSSCCMVAGGFSLAAFILSYTDKIKDKHYETKLIEGTSSYIQKYNGRSPEEPIEYAIRTLRIVSENETFKESSKKLEEELIEINNEIKESKNKRIYDPILKDAGKKMKKVSDKKDKNWIAHGIIALLNLGLGTYGLAKVD